MKTKYPKISIVIPLYIKTPYFDETVERCLALDYPDFEILIGVDRKTKVVFFDKRVRVLKTGEKRTGPAEKRDIGIRKARGEVIAFLDDDSYPEIDWLKKGMQIMQTQKVSAVCGPGLTPPKDEFAKQLTGAIIGSPFGSGPYYYRFVKGTPQFVDDYPAYNMLVKKSTLTKIGGFGTKFYGGEDTALCLKIINAGEKIYYHPDIVVYHHRRSFPVGYIKQVGNVGKHRGYFVKAYPATSLRPSYFGPPVLTIITPVFAFLMVRNMGFLTLFLALFGLYYAAVVFEAAKRNSLAINLALPFAILVNHYAYGINFLKGLFTHKLVR